MQTLHKNSDDTKARDMITKPYQDYPNDYRIMHDYMWHLAGDLSDNDSEVLSEHKDEFLMICDKIFQGCTEEALRLSACFKTMNCAYPKGDTKMKFIQIWYPFCEHFTDKKDTKCTFLQKWYPCFVEKRGTKIT